LSKANSTGRHILIEFKSVHSISCPEHNFKRTRKKTRNSMKRRTVEGGI